MSVSDSVQKYAKKHGLTIASKATQKALAEFVFANGGLDSASIRLLKETPLCVAKVCGGLPIQKAKLAIVEAKLADALSSCG